MLLLSIQGTPGLSQKVLRRSAPADLTSLDVEDFIEDLIGLNPLDLKIFRMLFLETHPMREIRRSCGVSRSIFNIALERIQDKTKDYAGL
jgi:hypothetical protein